ncbi:protein of unknown function [Nitratireductor aquimarinus]
MDEHRNEADDKTDRKIKNHGLKYLILKYNHQYNPYICYYS